MPAGRTWLWWLLAGLGAVIVFATLAPKGWPVRLGLHWLVEHVLAYFVVTLLACLAWPRPMLVAMLLLPVAVGLEAAQVALGHAKADVTQVYAERDTELAREVMRKIG